MRNPTTTLRKFLAAVLFMLPALSMTAQQPVLSENFEAWDGVTADWLPEGWSEINTNAEQAAMNDGIFTWQVASKRTGQTIPDAVEGSRFAIVYYAYGYDENNKRVDLAQDEWLVSPQFAVQAGDSLLFQLGYSPLYLFDLNNENINWGSWTFTNKKPSTTLQVMVRPAEGEWTKLYDVYDEWADSELKELFDNYSASTYHPIALSLAGYEGKEVQVAFRFVGKFGNTMELDAICVKSPIGGGDTAVRSLTDRRAPCVSLRGNCLCVENYAGVVTVWDAGGRQVAEMPCAGTSTLPLSSLPHGLCIVRLADGRSYRLLR